MSFDCGVDVKIAVFRLCTMLLVLIAILTSNGISYYILSGIVRQKLGFKEATNLVIENKGGPYNMDISKVPQV